MRELRYEIGFDWLAFTYVDKAHPEATLSSWDGIQAEIATDYDRTATPEAWASNGYRGLKIGKISIGSRHDGAMLQCTSHWATHPALLSLSYSNVPRCDVQCTIWGLPFAALIPRMVANSSYKASLKCGRKPWSVTLYDTYSRGDTAYLGSRKSERFIRIYDKYAETKDAYYEGSVRVELQTKNKDAAALYRHVGGGSEAAYRASAAISDALLSKGIDFRKYLLVQDALPPPRIRQEESTTDAKLLWLERQVAPTVRKLRAAGVSYEMLHRILFGEKHAWGIDILGDGVIDYRCPKE